MDTIDEHHDDPHGRASRREPRAVAGTTTESRSESRGHPVPLSDLVARARTAHERSGVRRPDILTTATVYGAALLATAGFAIASIIDELVRTRRATNTRFTSS